MTTPYDERCWSSALGAPEAADFLSWAGKVDGVAQVLPQGWAIVVVAASPLKLWQRKLRDETLTILTEIQWPVPRLEIAT